MTAGRKTTLFREVNERIEELLRSFGAAEEADFLCECPSADCMRRITLSRAAFDRIRVAGAFAVSLECARWATEVARTADYAVVESFLPPTLAAIRAAGAAERSLRARSRRGSSLPAPSLLGSSLPVSSQRGPQARPPWAPAPREPSPAARSRPARALRAVT
jgi:hypothetical protein